MVAEQQKDSFIRSLPFQIHSLMFPTLHPLEKSNKCFSLTGGFLWYTIQTEAELKSKMQESYQSCLYSKHSGKTFFPNDIIHLLSVF